jgi:hypothetical protein
MIYGQNDKTTPIRLYLREEWIPLLLHKYIVDKLHANPSFVLDIAGENLLKRAPEPGLEYTMAHQWFTEWVDLVLNKDIDGITAICLGEMVHDADMRQVSPFTGILTQEERVRAFRDARYYWELYKSSNQQIKPMDWLASDALEKTD